MKKRIAAFLLSAVAACTLLAGCSESPAPASPTPPPASSSTAPSKKDDPESPSSSPDSKPETPDSTPETPEKPETPETPDPTKEQRLRFDSFTYNIVRTNVASYNAFAFFRITNPNASYDVNFVRINYSVSDANGKIVKTGWDYIPSIAAGDTITFSTVLNVSSQAAVTSFSYTLDYDSCVMTEHSSTQFAKRSELAVSDVIRVPSSYSSFTGKVTNHSSTDIPTVTVEIIYIKDGKFIARDAAYPCSESSYTDPLRAGSSTTFKALATYEPEEYDSYITSVNIRYSFK